MSKPPPTLKEIYTFLGKRLSNAFKKETPDVGRLDPISARSDVATIFGQEPLFTDTLQAILSSGGIKAGLKTDLSVVSPVAAQVRGLDPVINFNPDMNAATPEARQRLLMHEVGHVFDFGGIDDALRSKVRSSYEDAKDVSIPGVLFGQQITKNPIEHFAGAFQNALDFVRSTPGSLYENQKYQWTPDDAEEVLPGTKPIIEWLSAKGFSRR